MALITKTYTFSNGATIFASEHNTNFDTVYDLVNGNLTNENIATGAAIAGSKVTPTFTANTSITGNLTLSAAGNKCLIKEGANASMGTALLQGGTAIVSTTLIAAQSRIFISNIALGGTAGALYVASITTATSFKIQSTVATDSSKVAWLVIEPA